MKKTFITLLALGGVAVGASGKTFTLDSSLYESGQVIGSAYGLIVGKSKTGAASATGLEMDQLGYKDCIADIFFEDMYSSVALGEGEKYMLTSISFAYRDKDVADYNPTSGSASFTLNGITYNADSFDINAQNGTIGTITFNFNEGIEIDGTEKIKLRMSTQSQGKGFGFAVAKDKGAKTIEGTNDFTNGYNPIVRLSGYVVPEPTTATLSLLALAGLAARRRR